MPGEAEIHLAWKPLDMDPASHQERSSMTKCPICLLSSNKITCPLNHIYFFINVSVGVTFLCFIAIVIEYAVLKVLNWLMYFFGSQIFLLLYFHLNEREIVYEVLCHVTMKI